MPLDRDMVAKSFLDFLQAHGRRKTPGSQVVGEFDDFDGCVHCSPPVFDP
jgi:hypothetical protein